MKKTTFKKLLMVMILLILTSIILPQISKAAVLQANPTTNSKAATKTGPDWISAVRQMETTGQAMGLTETIDSTSKLATTGSNGIDVHMMKNTEYGALAILSASGFGNPSNEKTIDTTTGNKTGVYMQVAVAEMVAGVGTMSGMDGTTISHRYFNKYTSSVKPGDALGLNWHNCTSTTSAPNWESAFVRGGTMGVFGVTHNKWNHGWYPGGTRAVVVCATGF